MRLSLNVPEQHDLDDPRLELDVRKLGRSLSELPTLDLSESLYRLTSYVEPLNEQKLESMLRYALLNTLAPYAQSLFDAVSPENLSWRRMADNQQAAVIVAVERLSLALANGYKIVLKHWFAESVATSEPKLFAQALRRTCRQLGNVLVHCYRCQRPVPPYVLFELNQLYRVGSHFELLRLAGTVESGQRAPGLIDRYVALMLLSAIHVRLQPAHVPGVHRALLGAAGCVQLLQDNIGKAGTEHVYTAELAADKPPRRDYVQKASTEAPELCMFDARPLADALLKRLAARPSRERDGSNERRALDALYPST